MPTGQPDRNKLPRNSGLCQADRTDPVLGLLAFLPSPSFPEDSPILAAPPPLDGSLVYIGLTSTPNSASWSSPLNFAHLKCSILQHLWSLLYYVGVCCMWSVTSHDIILYCNDFIMRICIWELKSPQKPSRLIYLGSADTYYWYVGIFKIF